MRPPPPHRCRFYDNLESKCWFSMKFAALIALCCSAICIKRDEPQQREKRPEGRKEASGLAICESKLRNKNTSIMMWILWVGVGALREWELQSLPRGCILSVEILMLTFGRRTGLFVPFTLYSQSQVADPTLQREWTLESFN
jgi:hypothetical protein